MIRKGLVFCLVLLLFAGTAWAAKDVIALQPEKSNAQRGPVYISEYAPEDLIALHSMLDGTYNYYLGTGDLEDTLLVVLNPLAPCSLRFIEFAMYTPGALDVFLASVNPVVADSFVEWTATWDWISFAGMAPPRGATNVSPIGAFLFGPYSTTTAGEEENLITEDLLVANPVVVGDPVTGAPAQFIGGFVKQATLGDPFPLADDVTDRSNGTWTWYGGPSSAASTASLGNVWGGYDAVADYGGGGTMIEMGVIAYITYDWGHPPLISGTTGLPNTVNGDKVCSVTSDLYDDGTVASVSLWSRHDVFNAADTTFTQGTPAEVAMTDANADGTYEADFTLVSAAVGDRIWYWLTAVDDEAKENSTEPAASYFDIIEIDDADILVINESPAEEDVILTYLDNSDVDYALYAPGGNKGIDQFLVDEGTWGNILNFGWGTSTVQMTGLGDNVYETFIDAGGNFLYSDMDYFFSWTPDAEVTFAAGDFAYDYLGIAGGSNDPADADGNPLGDPILTGVADDPVSGYFADVDLKLLNPNVASYNWSDYLTPAGDAISIFSGATDGETYGVRYEATGHGKTVYFGFDPTFASTYTIARFPENSVVEATYEFGTLMNNVLDYFAVIYTNGVREDLLSSMPMRFELGQNYPNPFNPTTQISFNLPTPEKVILKIFNLNGREVATLQNAHMGAGLQTISFDASNLASGVYFYRIEAGNYAAQKKMVLVK